MTAPFLEKLRAALEAGTFVKVTLSEPRDAAGDLRNVYGRVVELREGRFLSLLWRYARRDETKNVPLAEAPAAVEELLATTFARAHLFTTTGDFRWQPDRPIKASRPTFTMAPAAEHDRPKTSALHRAPFLVALGVTNAAGEARPGMADKLRQIERFVELLGHLIADSPLRAAREVRVVDLGSGKGYLTFAAGAWFRGQNVAARVTGVEARAELVAASNRIAQENAVAGLDFVAGTIAEFAPSERIDVLLALHACDTATDDAIHLGIRAGAGLIVTAPCCHQEVRPRVVVPAVVEPIWRHGILAERSAEVLTDALRALLLEIHGYKASVFEFISPEHTSKNVIIAAQRREHPRDPVPLRARLRELMAFHGIHEQRLARLLGELE